MRNQAHTLMCGSGSGVAVGKSAVDREAANASRELKYSNEMVSYACVPYE